MLGMVERSWDQIPPPAGLGQGSHPATVADLCRLRVGGSFWAPVPRLSSIASQALVLVPLPREAAAARELWRSARASREAAALVLVLPQAPLSHGLKRLAAAARAAGSQLAAQPVDPHALLDRVREVWLAGMDEFGLLALLRGYPVMRRQRDGSWRLEDPARAAALLLEHTRYRDPFSGRPIDAAAAVGLLEDWRRILCCNRAIAVCSGMSLWKRRRIADLLATAETPVRFRRRARAAITAAQAREGAIAVWSTRIPRGLADAANAAGVQLCRVEDGFIRSLGLGSGLLPPASVVLDWRGMYFDPAQPSDLEQLLAATAFDDALRARARKLIDRLVAGNVSKYGAGGAAPPLELPAGRRLLLVPGQVSDDQSVRLGGGPVRGNLDLLRRVRQGNPDAFIVYRPHPDVDAGHRAGAMPDEAALAVADRIGRGGSITSLIDAVDEVHTLTSLAGFEALLRGRRVVTYGQPFYAGWGLTTDLAPVARRTRRLAVEELAAAALILYPRYIDPLTRLPCGPEVLVDRLAMADLWRPTLLMRLRRLQGRLRQGSWRRQALRPLAVEDALDA